MAKKATKSAGRSLRPVPAAGAVKRAPTPMPTSVLRWEDPPPQVRAARGKWWDGIVDELRRNRGRWGLVLLVKDLKTAIARRGVARKRLTPEGFEFQARPMPDGRGAVYACFKGTKVES